MEDSWVKLERTNLPAELSIDCCKLRVVFLRDKIVSGQIQNNELNSTASIRSKSKTNTDILLRYLFVPKFVVIVFTRLKAYSIKDY